MLPPVQLHDHLPLQAHEIYDIPPDRLLPPEPVAENLPAPDMRPQQTLGVGHFAAEFSGAVSGFSIRHMYVGVWTIKEVGLRSY
jgi:hypothetical protein